MKAHKDRIKRYALAVWRDETGPRPVYYTMYKVKLCDSPSEYLYLIDSHLPGGIEAHISRQNNPRLATLSIMGARAVQCPWAEYIISDPDDERLRITFISDNNVATTSSELGWNDGDTVDLNKISVCDTIVTNGDVHIRVSQLIYCLGCTNLIDAEHKYCSECENSRADLIIGGEFVHPYA